jgi:PAS domain S-box-containing protein
MGVDAVKDEGPSIADEPAAYRQFFLASNDAIVLTDVGGRIVSANPAWLALYGYGLDEVVGRTTRIIRSQHSDDALFEHMWRQIGDPAVGYWRGEIINKKKSGEEVPVLLSIQPVRQTGRIIGYMAVGIDISERKRAEEYRELYDALVRHDLKAPAAVTMTVLSALLDGHLGAIAPAQRDLLERARRKVQQMLDTVATSLDLQKLRRAALRLDIEDVDLFDVVRASFDTLAETAADRNIGLELRAGSDPAGVEKRLVLRLDPIQLQRCSDNLVKNAIEGAGRNGKVTVTISRSRDRVTVGVHNTGQPIAPDVRGAIFHPFSTYGKRGGTGLGAYGVRMLTEAMGGTVSFDTGADGTTFVLEFPMDASLTSG